MEDLAAARAIRWWHGKRRIGSIARAAAFIEDVGFALLFPASASKSTLHSLWETASDRPREDWGEEAERVWRWKDELPRRGLAWYGKFLRGRPSFLSPAALAELYPRAGRPDDFEGAGLSAEAYRIARILLRSGPQPTSGLREALDIEGRKGVERFSKAQVELGRALVVTHFGVEDEGTGWPSAVLELTARAFPIPRRGNVEVARRRAVRRFLDTMVAARPYELGNAFAWGADAARTALEELVARGEAFRDPPFYRPARA